MITAVPNGSSRSTTSETTASSISRRAACCSGERTGAGCGTAPSWRFRRSAPRCALNLAFNAHRGAERRKRHEGAVPQPAPVLSPEQHAARREMLEAVVSEVVLLEEPFGTAVIMRFYDELSPKEIASRLG